MKALRDTAILYLAALIMVAGVAIAIAQSLANVGMARFK